MKHTLHISSTHISIHSPEKDLHILESPAFGLLDEEVDKDKVGSAEDAKHEEDAPANVVDGAGCHVGDGEIEEPLGGGCHTHTVGSETRWEDLGDVDPGYGAPGCGVADHIEVDHDYHSNRGR